MKLETRIWVQQNCNNSDSSELGMWGVQRDADQLHLRDAHVSLNAGRVPAAKIQNAGFLNLWHVLHFSHHKKNLSGKCFPVTLYGDHSVVRLTKLASSAETQLLTITKIHFHLHSQRKENKHLTFRRDQGIHLDAGNLSMGTEGRRIGGRFGVFWHWLNSFFFFKT